MKLVPTGLGLLVGLFLIALSGCAVPQHAGRGKQMHLVEPGTHTGYWLYLPEDYIANDGRHPRQQRWPLVVTLHGLRPYDNAVWQNKEWQEEADRYGLIVIAPALRTCDSLTMQFPLRDATLPYVRQDERAILAVMDEVFRRTNADPKRVLLTSFSSGGYLAHFMANRHPERFSVLATRGSNFSPELLLSSQVTKYRDMPIGIFFGQNDFKVCRQESIEAVNWYRRNRFDVEARMVNGLGHERRPQVAAALFARHFALVPKTPPDLGQMVLTDIPAQPYSSSSRQPLTRHVPRSPVIPASAAPSGTRYKAGQDILFAEPASDGGLPSAKSRKETPAKVRAMPSYRTVPLGQNPSKPRVTPKRPVQPYSVTPQPAPRISKRDLADVPARERSSQETPRSTPDADGRSAPASQPAGA